MGTSTKINGALVRLNDKNMINKFCMYFHRILTSYVNKWLKFDIFVTSGIFSLDIFYHFRSVVMQRDFLTICFADINEAVLIDFLNTISGFSNHLGFFYLGA